MSEQRGSYVTSSSNDETHLVRDAGDPRKYYTQIPNIIDDMDLSPQAVRLYLHLKRVAGENGASWQSTDTLSKACRMSTGSVSEAKADLVEKHLISIATKIDKNGSHHEITIEDIWKENIEKYRGSSQCEGGSSQCETKNNPIKNIDPPATKPVAGTDVGGMVLTVGQKHFLKAFGGKRLNPTQLETLRQLEQTYGTDKLGEVVAWAANQGMAMSKAIGSIQTALPKWGLAKRASNNGNGYGAHPPQPVGAPTIGKEGEIYV